MTLEIILSQNQVSQIDDVDADLATMKWSALRRANKPRYPFYAVRDKGVSLHRVILSRMLGRELVKGEQVDHVSGDGLDNRRENLRLATPSQNGANQCKQSSNTSGFKGVSFAADRGKWRAQIQVNGKVKNLGRFGVAEEAARAYDKAAAELFGEFAVLNFH